MPIPDELAAILACPESKQPLIYFADEDFLFCPASKLKYKVEGGIPVMLVEDAVRLSDADAAALVARARREGLRNS